MRVYVRSLGDDDSRTDSASPSHVLRDLWLVAGGDPAALDRVTLTGADPALPSSFRVGTAAQATIAAAGLAAAEIWRQRTGRSADRRRRHAPRGHRVPQRALHAHRRQAAGARLGQDRRRLSHRRRPQGAPAHQLPASSRRHPEAAGLRLRARGGAGRAHEMGGGDIRDGGRRSQAGRHHDALAGRMGRAPAGPGGRAAAAARDHQDRRGSGPRRCPAAPSARSPASACSTSRASSPGRCAGARSPPTAPT